MLRTTKICLTDKIFLTCSKRVAKGKEAINAAHPNHVQASNTLDRDVDSSSTIFNVFPSLSFCYFLEYTKQLKDIMIVYQTLGNNTASNVIHRV